MRFWFRSTRQALRDPAGADVHHRAVRLSADLQEVGVGGSGTAFYVEHLGQIGLLAGLVDRHHVADLDVQKIGPVHELHAEPFRLVRLYCYATSISVPRQTSQDFLNDFREDRIDGLIALPSRLR